MLCSPRRQYCQNLPKHHRLRNHTPSSHDTYSHALRCGNGCRRTTVMGRTCSDARDRCWSVALHLYGREPWSAVASIPFISDDGDVLYKICVRTHTGTPRDNCGYVGAADNARRARYHTKTTGWVGPTTNRRDALADDALSLARLDDGISAPGPKTFCFITPR